MDGRPDEEAVDDDLAEDAVDPPQADAQLRAPGTAIVICAVSKPLVKRQLSCGFLSPWFVRIQLDCLQAAVERFGKKAEKRGAEGSPLY